MKTCTDCGVELTAENRSIHQPSIRCLACFEAFCVRTTAMFEEMNSRFDKRAEEVT